MNRAPTSSLPVVAGGQLGHHHPASPGLQVSLGGHLTARSILVHLPDPLHLAAAAQAHIRRRLNICSFVHRHWGEENFISYTAGLQPLRAPTSANNSPMESLLVYRYLCAVCLVPAARLGPVLQVVLVVLLLSQAGSAGPAAPGDVEWLHPAGCCASQWPPHVLRSVGWSPVPPPHRHLMMSSRARVRHLLDTLWSN